MRSIPSELPSELLSELSSELWIRITAVLKLLNAVIAEAMSGQIVSGSALLNNRKVIVEKHCS
jgi:hypothetical protein